MDTDSHADRRPGGNAGQPETVQSLQQFREAVQALQEALACQPDDVEAYLAGNAGQPETAKSLQEFREVVQAFQESLECQLDDVEAYLTRADALFRLQRFDEVREILDQAIERHPEDAELLVYKGRFRRLRGDSDALELFRQAVALDPQSLEAHCELSSALMDIGNYSEAFHEAEQAVAINPDRAEPWIVKGTLFQLQSHLTDALAAFDEAIVREPDNPDAYSAKSQVLIELERHDDALETLDQGLSLLPADPDLLAAKGQALLSSNRIDEAIEILKSVIQHDDAPGRAFSYLGMAHTANNSLDEAWSAYDQALRIDDRDTLALSGKGELLLMRGELEKAKAFFDNALNIDPDDPFALRNLGYVLQDLHRDDDALHSLQKAAELDPQDATLLVDLARAYETADDYVQALATVEQAISLEPDYYFALTAQGDLLCDIGEFERASQVLLKAQNCPDSDWRCYASRGWALEFIGADQAEEAVRMYEAAAREHAAEKESEGDNELWIQDEFWIQNGLANALHISGQIAMATDKYRWIIDEIKKRQLANADMLYLKGWCNYCIGEFFKAERLFIDALALDESMLSTQFDLALTILCTKRFGLAKREYRRGLEQTKKLQKLRQRGLLYVAFDDIQDAAAIDSELRNHEQFRECVVLLEEALKHATG